MDCCWFGGRHLSIAGLLRWSLRRRSPQKTASLPNAKRLAATFRNCRASQDVTIAYCLDALDQAGSGRVRQSAPRRYDGGLAIRLGGQGGDASVRSGKINSLNKFSGAGELRPQTFSGRGVIRLNVGRFGSSASRLVVAMTLDINSYRRGGTMGPN